MLTGDGRFRLFLYSQWLGGATLTALPLYVVAADKSGITPTDVGLLFGAQTAGALASNPLWGKLGDSAGKLAMLQTAAAVRMLLFCKSRFSPGELSRLRSAASSRGSGSRSSCASGRSSASGI